MSATGRIYIQDCGVITALGDNRHANARNMFAASRDGLVQRGGMIPGKNVWVGAVTRDLPAVPAHLQSLDCRNNRLLQAALDQIAPAVAAAAARYGKDRIAIVMGSSTSGISDGEDALTARQETGLWPENFAYSQQEIGNPGIFAARYFGLNGPAYTIATACSSSAKVFASARRLIRMGLADAALVGGADTLCRMTLNGFNALELVSANPCNPFSANRDGITIGEGASAFLLSKDKAAVEFLGAGETSDAYHLTAPSPDGIGAQASMQQALDDAKLSPDQIAYINLHGTATPLNDAMEARAVASLFGPETPCGSTKGMTGHMLGATGGCEAAFLWLSLHPDYNPRGLLPPHAWDGAVDPDLPALAFVAPGTRAPTGRPLAMLSNAFGFGGSNASLIFGRAA